MGMAVMAWEAMGAAQHGCHNLLHHEKDVEAERCEEVRHGEVGGQTVWHCRYSVWQKMHEACRAGQYSVSFLNVFHANFQSCLYEFNGFGPLYRYIAA